MRVDGMAGTNLQLHHGTSETRNDVRRLQYYVKFDVSLSIKQQLRTRNTMHDVQTHLACDYLAVTSIKLHIH